MGSDGEMSVCAHLSPRPLHQCTAESWGRATRFGPSRSHSTQNGEDGARSPGRLLWLLSQQHWRAQAAPTERTSPPGLLQVLLTSKSLFPPPIGMSFYPEKEEKKKWKDLKMMKKLERQRVQEEQAKRQQEEEAAAQREDRGEQAGSSVGQRML